MKLEAELEKLKAEKELSWVDSGKQSKLELEKDVLSQEVARLNEKVRRLTFQVEDSKKKEEEWNSKDSKYQATFKNLKKTIADLKKDADMAASSKQKVKSVEEMYTESSKLRKEYEEDIKLLYTMLQEQVAANLLLKDDRKTKRYLNVESITSSLSIFQ